MEKTGEERERERERLTASPLVSSHRPNTEFAAARTEHLELRVVVIPAYSVLQSDTESKIMNHIVPTNLSDGYSLLLHGLMNSNSIILSHL